MRRAETCSQELKNKWQNTLPSKGSRVLCEHGREVPTDTWGLVYLRRTLPDLMREGSGGGMDFRRNKEISEDQEVSAHGVLIFAHVVSLR
jgi:hypothetical protein